MCRSPTPSGAFIRHSRSPSGQDGRVAGQVGGRTEGRVLVRSSRTFVAVFAALAVFLVVIWAVSLPALAAVCASVVSVLVVGAVLILADGMSRLTYDNQALTHVSPVSRRSVAWQDMASIEILVRQPFGGRTAPLMVRVTLRHPESRLPGLILPLVSTSARSGAAQPVASQSNFRCLLASMEYRRPSGTIQARLKGQRLLDHWAENAGSYESPSGRW